MEMESGRQREDYVNQRYYAHGLQPVGFLRLGKLPPKPTGCNPWAYWVTMQPPRSFFTSPPARGSTSPAACRPRASACR